MRCFDCMKDKKVLCFVGGVATALVGTKIVKSQLVRKGCVNGLAKGMKLQKDAQAVFQNMKEEAEDICYDAQQENTCCQEPAEEKTEKQ